MKKMFKILTGLVWLMIIGMIAAISIPKSQAQAVYSDGKLQAAVERALWQVNMRAGTTARYVGATTGTLCVEGSITAQVATFDAWKEVMTGVFTPGAFAHICGGYSQDGFYILYNPLVELFNGVDYALVTHEVMHAMGHWTHTPGGLMDVEHVRSEFISQDELRIVIDTGWWPRAYAPDYCSAMLGLNNAIYIPEVGGKSIELTMASVNEWRVSAVRQIVNPVPCDTVRFNEDGSVSLARVISPGAQYAPTFAPAGNGVWKLVSLRKML